MADTHYTALTTYEIRKFLLNDKKSRKIFNGVFAADTLPKYVSKNTAYVVNTDPISMSGSHWVAIYFDKEGNGEYFDSYGLPPIVYNHKKFILNNSHEYTYNKSCLQSVTSSVCGHYCILYIGARARNLSMHEFISKFDGPDVYSNDAIAILNFRKYYDHRKNGKSKVDDIGLKCKAQCACAKS